MSFTFHQHILTAICENIEEDSHTCFKTAMKALKSQIKQNPSSRVDGDVIYDTVENPYNLPKVKDVEKNKTRWEKFAEEKGIKNRNRSRREFSEETQRWEFKFGSKSVQNQKLQSGLVELESGSISQVKRDKQKRISKNIKNREANKKRRLGVK